jgi:hypothetical protein
MTTICSLGRLVSVSFHKGSTQVAFLLDHSKVTGSETTSEMMAVRFILGLEFVRTLDRHKLSIIVLAPFVVSVAFAAIWIGVSIGTFGVDAQVAVQTASTVAGFIVNSGKVKSKVLLPVSAFADNMSIL